MTPSKLRRRKLGIGMRLGRSVVVLALASGVARAAGATGTPEGDYRRWHDSAVAFAETVGKIEGRYPGLRALDQAAAGDLIARSERAAQRRDFDEAGRLAREAYQRLTSSIKQAVEDPRRAAAAR